MNEYRPFSVIEKSTQHMPCGCQIATDHRTGIESWYPCSDECSEAVREVVREARHAARGDSDA